MTRLCFILASSTVLSAVLDVQANSPSARKCESVGSECQELEDTTLLLHTSSVIAVSHQAQRPTVVSKASTAEQSYYWPSARGHVGSYGVSQFSGPRDLSRGPTWTWQENAKSRWSNIPTGICIDGKKNIYLTLADGITKFTPDGHVMWVYKRTSQEEEISDAGSIYNGAAYGITTKGRVFAVDMETGKEIWSTITGPSKTLNYGQTAAHDGVVIVASQSGKGWYDGADDILTGLNANDGSILWTFTPEVPVWNFAANFVGDGTFIYQDLMGGAYRNFVSNGSLIWKMGGIPGSWTDGQASVGPNGIVYSVANHQGMMETGVRSALEHQGSIGALYAWRLSDGKPLWNQSTSRPPNDVPVVGRLAGQVSDSVVLPGGMQGLPGEQIVVYAFDAETGKPQWTFLGPRQQSAQAAGDLEGVFEREKNKIRSMTVPNPWGQATIDKDGIVYVGGITGHFFSLRDADGDGNIDQNKPNEVSIFETGAAFVGSSGPAIADGLMAVAAQDRLHVWQW